MSHKKCARDFGVVLFLIGLLACIPGLTLDSYFLGVFKVNLYTNALHLGTGLIAYLLSHSSSKNAKKTSTFPRQLTLMEYSGVLMGPWYYLLSRRRAYRHPG